MVWFLAVMRGVGEVWGLAMRKLNLPMILLALPGWAGADAGDTVNLFAGVSHMRDSNLFRAPDGQEESDQVTATYWGLQLDKQLSLQRFVVDARMTDFRYQDNSYLDYMGKDYKAAWHWSMTPRLHGTLSAAYGEVLNSFVDYTGRLKNIRSTENYRFDAEWEATGGLRLLGGISRHEQKNSQLFLAEGDYSANAAELGLKYVFASGSSVALLGRNTRGEYEERDVNPISLVDTGFEQRNQELRLRWLATPKSRLDLNLGYLDREHEHYAQRDFSGAVGSLDYNWDVSGKFRLNAGFRQDLNSYQNFQSSYYRQRSYSISPLWQLGPKTALRARFRRDERDYLGGLMPGAGGREDVLRQMMLSVEWVPASMLMLSLSAQRETRDSNHKEFEFDDRILNFSAQITF